MKGGGGGRDRHRDTWMPPASRQAWEAPMCMDWKWFLQIREPTRICARVPPGAPAPRALTPCAAATDGGIHGEREAGRRGAPGEWGERQMPLGSGQLAVVSWGAPGAGCGEPQTAEVGVQGSCLLLPSRADLSQRKAGDWGLGKPVGRGW